MRSSTSSGEWLRGDRCTARECSRRYVREHYARNKAYYIAKAHKRKAAYLDEVRAYVLAHLREHPCVDCGETDPVVLQFDHADPAEKLLAVSVLVVRGFALLKIVAEIAKMRGPLR